MSGPPEAAKDPAAGQPAQPGAAPQAPPGGTASRGTRGRRGRPDHKAVPSSPPDSYYGQAILKDPTWTWEIPLYFFTGGLAGASGTLAALAQARGEDVLATRAWLVAMGALAVSPPLLISDLGRPERFYNMLRVFKPTSPMSVGSWILTACGGVFTLGAARGVLGWFPRLGRVAATASALTGPALSTYTAVLVTDTAIPVWHEARRELPLVFAASSAAAAGAAVSLVTPAAHRAPARRLAVAGALAELAAVTAMEHRLGEAGEPYQQGVSGRLARAAKAATGLGAAAAGLGARRRAWLGPAGAVGLLAGSLLERWAVYKAGFASARDPKYVVRPQRARLEARGGVPSRRHPTGVTAPG